MQRVAKRVRVPLGFLFAAVFLWRAHPTTAALLAGLPLVAAGAVLRAYASGYVKKNAELATDGPYAYTRNPLYLGSLVLALGFVLPARSLLLLLFFLVLFAIIYVPTILQEEAWLRANFASFDSYCAAVPRLLPRLNAARFADGTGPRGSFSRELYLKHREYNATMGIAAIYAVLAVKMWLHW